MVPSSRQLNKSRRGLTLIEVMVSLAAAMVVLAAVISVLGMVTKGIADSRSMIEVTNRLRSAQVLLRNDLAGATSPGLVWQKGEAGNGYLEIIDGPIVDDQKPANDTSALSLNGDTDDIIMLTTRSSHAPFVGKTSGGGTITSPVAEVAWFLKLDRTLGDGTKVYNLHRRTFLICNNVSGVTSQFSSGTATDPLYDLSYRSNGTAVVPCSLGDLSVRKNRAYHGTNTAIPAPSALTGDRLGEDIVLTNVLSFDIKVFDPTATNRGSGNLGLVPGDRGFSGGTAAGNGAYVDLGQNTDPTQYKGNGTRFNIAMESKSSLPVAGVGNPTFTYDTWSFDYEYGGNYVNGLDDNADGVVDDANERQTMPPYPYALRGVQIKIRVYEPSSKQVREVTVEETFVP
jgi:type II secretory pathway component PulJ